MAARARLVSTRLAMLSLFPQALRAKSVDLITQTVTGIERSGNRAAAVTLANGERLEPASSSTPRGPTRARWRNGGASPFPSSRASAASSSSKHATGLPTCRAGRTPPASMSPQGSVYIAGGAESEEGEQPPILPTFEPEWPLFEEVIWPRWRRASPPSRRSRRPAPGPAIMITTRSTRTRSSDASGSRQLHIRQRLFRPRAAAGASRRRSIAS